MADRIQKGMLTVAAIRKPKGKGATEYLFNESPRIFTFASKTRAALAAEKALKTSLQNNLAVRAQLNVTRGIITDISELSVKERDKFQSTRILLPKPEKPRKIELANIDPVSFNVVDHYLKSPLFKLCVRTIPSYKKAKEIFDYCAQQSCHLPAPHDVSPCIPFQYVIDGCYARAHKMRWIITKKYRYCCEKVFSFANQGSDRLAVTADKWGGCCVTWWYHVAPLVRVRVKLGKISKLSFNLAMVIDPGMFDKPVLLSSWLAAQEKTVCHANANVSMYSIQPGSAYSPANYAGTAFTTDPAYTATDATLTNYKNRTTC